MKWKVIYKQEFWMITIFILFLAGASAFVDSQAEVFGFVLLLGFLYYKKGLNISIDIIIFITLWIGINLFSAIIANPFQSFSFKTVFSRLMYPFLIYFIIQLTGANFYRLLSRYAYYLVLISLPLFAIQIAIPSLFKSISGIFSFMTKPFYTEANGMYAFVFRYTDWHISRNCGFMWEPGGFAGILIFLISYRLATNNFEIDNYVGIFFLALLTSQSTAGYLAIVFIIAAYFVKKQKANFFLVLLIPILIIAAYYLYQLEFISEKITRYQEVGTDSWGMMEDGVQRTTRLGIALITLHESLHWPFGHGVIDHSAFQIEHYGKIYGPSGLVSILHQWGWIGIIITIIVIYKFYRGFQDHITSFLLTGGVLIILFSNPNVFKLLIYSILFTITSIKKEMVSPHKEKFGNSNN